MTTSYDPNMLGLSSRCIMQVRVHNLRWVSSLAQDSPKVLVPPAMFENETYLWSQNENGKSFRKRSERVTESGKLFGTELDTHTHTHMPFPPLQSVVRKGSLASGKFRFWKWKQNKQQILKMDKNNQQILKMDKNNQQILKMEKKQSADFEK